MKCYYWERKVTKVDAPEQLQVVAVFANDVATAYMKFDTCAGRTIIENVLTDITQSLSPRVLPKGAQEVFQMLLNRYTIQEAEDGKVARMYKYTPGRVILILGENARPKPEKIDMDAMLKELDL